MAALPLVHGCWLSHERVREAADASPSFDVTRAHDAAITLDVRSISDAGRDAPRSDVVDCTERGCRYTEEWEPACRAVGEVVTATSWRPPYVVDESVCNLSGYGDGLWEASSADFARRVGEAAHCRAANPPYDVLLDMIGNAGEYASSPDASERGVVMVGGSYLGGPYDPCEDADRFHASEPRRGAGIRCCAD